MTSKTIKLLTPIFVSGVRLIQISTTKFLIGNQFSTEPVPDSSTALILNAIDGKTSISELAQTADLSVSDVLSHLQPFVECGYIRFTDSNLKTQTMQFIKSNQLMQSELGEVFLTDRIIGELGGVMTASKTPTGRTCSKPKDLINIAEADHFESAKTSHQLEKLLSRSNFQIMIFGTNRSALNLFGLLQSIGFSKTKIFNGFNDSPKPLCNADICGASVRTHDHGLDLEIRKEQVQQEQNLFRFIQDSYAPQMTKPDLIISLVPVPPDYQQRWMCESTTHLVIGPYLNGQISMGPLVIPGQTPCLNCHDLNNRQFRPGIAEIEINYLNFEQSEMSIPSAQLWVVLGKLAIAISEWADTQTSSLAANQTILDFRNYQNGSGLDQFQRVLPLSFNPMCGCRQIP